MGNPHPKRKNLPSKGQVSHILYENLGQWYLVQDEEARQLHSLAGVPEGPCGVKELQKFQQALGSQYQLLVMCRSKPLFLNLQETGGTSSNPSTQIGSTL